MPGTKGFRYVYSTLHISNLLNKIHTAGRPDKLSFAYARDTWLFKNEQYRAVLDILKDMEFIDNSGVPTQLYARYQNPALAKQTLAEGIKKAYPALFKAYPNAQSLPKADLEGYFRQQTGKSGSVLEKMLSTFRTLCSRADFSGIEVLEKITPEYEGLEERKKIPKVSVEPNIQVNIEIHIATDMPDEKIETIFKNMRRYLFTNE